MKKKSFKATGNQGKRLDPDLSTAESYSAHQQRSMTMNTVTMPENATATIPVPGDTVRALVEEVKAGVAQIQGSEDWKRWLESCSKFWKYSFHNQMLIAIQKPSASLVAGFHTWKEMGRWVKKGEHGIRILAPVMVKVKDENEPETEVVRAIRFRAVSVFDLAQTEGKDMPEVSKPLSGEAPEDMLDKVQAYIESQGYTVRLGETPSGVYGYVNISKEIVLKEGEGTAQTLDTLCHEVSHALLGHLEDKGLSRDEKELEAETAAWVVCRNLGLETRDSSFGYLAAWARGKERDTKLEKAAQRACEVAKKILEGVCGKENGNDQN